MKLLDLAISHALADKMATR